MPSPALRQEEEEEAGGRAPGLFHTFGVSYSHTRGFDDYVIEFLLFALLPPNEIADHLDEVVTDSAAQATVVQKHHVLGDVRGAGHNVAVDADLPELVDDDGNFFPVVLRENPVHQCRLATSEETCHNRNGH